MTKIIQKLPADDQSAIHSSFQKLKQICFPEASLFRPRISCLSASELPSSDGLIYGSLGNAYYIPPSELKTLWQDRQTLRDSYVDYIKVNNTKWFYNTSYLMGDFYEQNGQKKVSIQFGFWMDAEKIWPMPGVKKAVKDVLTLYSGQEQPTEQQVQSCFSPELCRSIYERNPSAKSMGPVVMDLIETVRKALVRQLVKGHVPEITGKKDFQNWVNEKTERAQKSPTQQVQEYLKERKNAIYIVAEELNYITKASRLIRYQELRDSVRHPKDVKTISFNPTEVYADFATALHIRKTNPSKRGSMIKFADNSEISDNIAQMSEILDILQIYEDKTLKKKDPAYWQVLVQKGVLSAKDVPLLQQKITEYNSVAHHNQDASKFRSKIADDTEMLGLNERISEAHQQKLNQWLYGFERDS